MLEILNPEQYSIKTLNLGDKIIRNNQFTINVPYCGLLLGIEHINIISNMVFIFSNFKQIYRINGKLIQFKEYSYWSISDYLIPMFKTLEQSNDLKLEIEIHINNNKKNKFYNFNALYVDIESIDNDKFNQIKNVAYLSIPTIYPDVKMEWIVNIWRIIKTN